MHTCKLEELGIFGDSDAARPVGLGFIVALSRLVAERRRRIRLLDFLALSLCCALLVHLQLRRPFQIDIERRLVVLERGDTHRSVDGLIDNAATLFNSP